MGKRYYCDFCDKSFPNDRENRRKHNEGQAHLTNRALFYSKYKDLETILYEEREKKPCLKYLNSGYCAFGEICRNSHRTPQEVVYLESLYRIECHEKIKAHEEKIKEEKEAEKKRKRRQQSTKFHSDALITEFLTKQSKEDLEKFLPKCELPKDLKGYDPHLLPPSLKPPSFKDLIDYPFSEFGS